MQSLGESGGEDLPGRTDGLQCRQPADQEAADFPAPLPAADCEHVMHYKLCKPHLMRVCMGTYHELWYANAPKRCFQVVYFELHTSYEAVVEAALLHRQAGLVKVKYNLQFHRKNEMGLDNHSVKRPEFQQGHQFHMHFVKR